MYYLPALHKGGIFFLKYIPIAGKNRYNQNIKEITMAFIYKGINTHGAVVYDPSASKEEKIAFLRGIIQENGGNNAIFSICNSEDTETAEARTMEASRCEVECAENALILTVQDIDPEKPAAYGVWVIIGDMLMTAGYYDEYVPAPREYLLAASSAKTEKGFSLHGEVRIPYDIISPAENHNTLEAWARYKMEMANNL